MKELKTISDEKLLRQIQSGNDDAMECLLERYRDMEMKPLGIKKENIEVDFTEGDTVVVTGGVWKDTIGVIQAMNHGKQSVTINVELFGRETPVEISFADVKLNN